MIMPNKTSENLRRIVLVCLCGVVILSVSLLIFARRSGWYAKESAAGAEPALMNKPLPAANLVDSDGVKLEDPALRKGKVLLVFMALSAQPVTESPSFLKPSSISEKTLTCMVSFPLASPNQP
jgi:hypothetical protein